METHFLPLPPSEKIAKKIGCKHYFTGKPCKYGHVTYRYAAGFSCAECSRLSCKKWQEENPDKLRDSVLKHRNTDRYQETMARSHAVYRKRNPEKVKQWKRDYRKRNPEAAYASVRQWLDNNPGYTKEASQRQRDRDPDGIRAYMREYRKQRMQDDPDFAMSFKVRSILRRTLLATNQKKNNPTAAMLGYTSEDLRQHLERHMLPGMSWDNYGEAWHIDHTISVAEYIRLGVTDPSIINALSNLMPMWSEDNMSKSDGFSLSPPVVQ